MEQEQLPSPKQQGAILVGPFSTDEAEKLLNERVKYRESTEYLERVTDTHRRDFVRYLLAMGDLEEFAE